MDATKTTEYARALLSSRGGKAEAEAARRMQEATKAGKPDEAEDWRRIRLAISEMRGPRQG
ncbi:hypothetical protein DQW77_10000 [Roseovarius sp. TE539]|uniref:hypothetical protein n=1 Tax=Roseovarius sp. TE539 TaxID=2249812 RepID=UPI000DE09B6D|nr:hypothetical protein [Roseovarius sp. TE539]RBI72675.1 hypothetical protein DQW77_10000 [Roseovarius sp. TE539]